MSEAQEKEMVTSVCEVCGDEYEVHPYRAGETVMCSAECRSEWLSQNNVGENHVHWSGGGQVYYGQEWDDIRERVRKRDGYGCQICGISEDNMEQELDVHHIDPVDSFENVEDAHDTDNLISLCRSCHQQNEGESMEVRA